MINPIDAFGAAFTEGPLYAGYLQARSDLQPGNAALYAQHKTDLLNFLSIPLSVALFETIEPATLTDPAWQNPAIAESVWSFRLWGMVKLWEINHEYGLEDTAMASAAFSSRATAQGIPLSPANANRAWYSNQPFMTSPSMSTIPHPNPGVDNGTLAAYSYEMMVWYQLQLILNDGNGTYQGTWPFDAGYTINTINGPYTWPTVTGAAGVYFEWLVKILQNGNFQDSQPRFLVFMSTAVPASGLPLFEDLSPTQRSDFMNNWISIWLQKVQSMTQAQLFSHYTSAVFDPIAPGSFTGDLASSLAPLKYFGASPTLLNQVVAWASGIWPAHNWQGDLNKTCVVNGTSLNCN
jgi:hypothetical protein